MYQAKIEAVRVNFFTTHDDKDTQITFSLSIDDASAKSIARVDDVGKDVLWDNDTAQPPVRIQLPPGGIDFTERLEYHLLIEYHSSDGYPGWEGRVEVVAELVGGSLHTVLNRTADFKLGEKGNPTRVAFPFDN